MLQLRSGPKHDSMGRAQANLLGVAEFAPVEEPRMLVKDGGANFRGSCAIIMTAEEVYTGHDEVLAGQGRGN